jgi:hypothetical protein
MTACILLVLCGTEANADPLLFSNVVALQNMTRVDLFSVPGVTLIGPQISFLIDVSGTLPASVPSILRVTYAETGYASVIKEFLLADAGVPPPFTVLFTFSSAGASPEGVTTALIVDILNQSPDFIIPGGPNAGTAVDSYSYSFKVATPVPEPVSIVLFGSGLAGVAAGVRWRRRIIKREQNSA